MTRRVLLLLATAVALLSVAPVPGTGAQEESSASPLEASGEGWWSLLSSRPDTDMGALVPSPATPAPEVPDGSIPVSARFGQTDKVAAIGVVLIAPPGSTVTSATLTLVEVDEATAQLRPADAAVLACPITTFFVPKQNGDLADAPEVDCDIANAEGERGDDGTWTFDVTSLVAAWLDGTVPANGIRFDPISDSGESFQVAFTGEEDAVFAADITEAEVEDPFDFGATTPPPPPAAGSGGRGGSAGGGFSSSPSFSPPSIQPAPPPTPMIEEPAAPPPTEAPRAEEVAIAPAASRAGDTFGNWPLSVFAALVAALLLALLAAWSLGRGRPTEAAVRPQRGVSRALAARTRLMRPETL